VRAVLRVREMLILLLAVGAQIILAQEEPVGQTKKNPVMRNAEISVLQKDSTSTPAKSIQRPLPKFDLPEFIITGTASIDLPKLEKITSHDSIVPLSPFSVSPDKIHRDRETLEFEMKNGGISRAPVNVYSGFAKAGIGTYFSPNVDIQYGQSVPEYFYTLGGDYSLTKGYAPNTDRSGGGMFASGGLTLSSPLQILQNAALDGATAYRSESFRYYGSALPDLQRTRSDFRIQAGLENQALRSLPYSAEMSLTNVNISDSTVSKSETRFDLKYETSFPVASLPLQTIIQFMTATGGLNFLDISVEAHNVWENGFVLEGSLHLSWAKGMEGQNIAHLSPRLLARYQLTSQHRVFLFFEQRMIPHTLASQMKINRFLSSAAIIHHEYVHSAGGLGLESNWTESVQSRMSLHVKSSSDLPMFSDSARQGVWMLAYGGRARIVTFCAEMVAKLNSNDYFASNILLRSAHDSFLDGKIPYVPAIEAWCSLRHRFGSTIAASAEIRITGERTTDLGGTVVLPPYTVLDVLGEYSPVDFLRFSAGIKNVTDAKFEMWRAYREFPFTMHVDAQIRW
jgi:hypothetical protein